MKYKPILSIGIMTGTSADAADFAAIEIAKKEKLIATQSFKFPAVLRKKILECQKGKATFVEVASLSTQYSEWLADCALLFIKKNKIKNKNTFFSIHGQTLWHKPPFFTVQMLDPSRIAVKTNCTVVFDFRKSDLALGGQGAPLVPVYHSLIIKENYPLSSLPISIHNIGGISNLTLVEKSNIIAFDTGPGNALIDLAMKREFKKPFDKDGKIAKSGLHKIDWKFITTISKNPYFTKNPPKSTGRELFNADFLNQFKSKKETLISEVTALTAYTMAYSYAKFCNKNRTPKTIYIAGGGTKNKTLINLFKECLRKFKLFNIKVSILPENLAPAQFLEAIAFARLGYESLRGKPVSIAHVTGAKKDAVGVSVFTAENFIHLIKSINR